MRVEIYGPMGTGKTTLMHAFAQASGFVPVPEPVNEHPYLKDYYADPERYALVTAMHFLSSYMYQMQQNRDTDAVFDTGAGLHQSYIDTMPLDLAGRKVMGEVYRALDEMPKPDLIIHLDYNPQEIMQRIRARGRDMEANVPLAYVENLHAALQKNLPLFSEGVPVFTVRPGDYDFIGKPEEGARLLQNIEKQAGRSFRAGAPKL